MTKKFKRVEIESVMPTEQEFRTMQFEMLVNITVGVWHRFSVIETEIRGRAMRIYSN